MLPPRLGSQNNPLQYIALAIFKLGMFLLIAGCTPQQEAAPTPTATDPSPEAATVENPTFTPEGIDLEDNSTVTFVGTVRDVVPDDNMIIIEGETIQGEPVEENLAVSMGPESVLVDKENHVLALTEIRRGTRIQATGHTREEDFLVAQHVVVLEEPPVIIETPSPQPTPAPPTPIALSDVSSTWIPHHFPELGIGLSMPEDWEIARVPGAYFFEPAGTTNRAYTAHLSVSGQGNVPTELPGMSEALIEQWQGLTRHPFYTTPIIVDGYEGLAFWNLSPISCVYIYVPAFDFVHALTFYSTFCNEAGDQLNEVGQKILESVELHPIDP